MASPNSNSAGIPVFDHTPFYCEENVYRLCKKLCSTGLANTEGSDLFVVFISNDKKQVPLWHQKANQRADGAVLWDYHVICIQRKADGSPNLVWGLDSNLSIPCQLEIYLAETIRQPFKLYSEYQRIFRVVHAPSFFLSFASDRRHMKDSAGNWMEDPPPYDPIVAQDGTVHNLSEYMEVKSEELTQNLEVGLLEKVYTEKLGLVISESQLKWLENQIGGEIERHPRVARLPLPKKQCYQRHLLLSVLLLLITLMLSLMVLYLLPNLLKPIPVSWSLNLPTLKMLLKKVNLYYLLVKALAGDKLELQVCAQQYLLQLCR